MITIRKKLNLIPGVTIPETINVSQYDKVSREVVFTLYNGDEVFTVPSGATVAVQGTKKDKTGFQYSCVVDGVTASFQVTEQMTVFPGPVTCELSIQQSGQVLGTANFILLVEPAALEDDTAISETEIPLIQKAAQASGYAEEAEQSAAAALESAGNAAASATAAAWSATASAGSASAAASSATDAATSASEAASSEAASAGSASAAAGSASEAASSASDADDSATAAGESATNAATSASEAAASASEAASTLSGAMKTADYANRLNISGAVNVSLYSQNMYKTADERIRFGYENGFFSARQYVGTGGTNFARDLEMLLGIKWDRLSITSNTDYTFIENDNYKFYLVILEGITTSTGAHSSMGAVLVQAATENAAGYSVALGTQGAARWSIDVTARSTVLRTAAGFGIKTTGAAYTVEATIIPLVRRTTS